MPGFEAIKPEQGPSAAEAQKSLDKAAVANRAAATAELANALGREGRHEESLTKGLEALDLCEEQKDKKGKGCCFYILGRTHFLKGALLSAQDMSAKALAIFQEVKDATWEEAAAKILLAAAVSSAGPGGAKAAVSIAPGDMQALSARCSAKRAAEAMQVAAECRRQSLLRMSEAKVLINRGDHEAALNCVADAFSLSEGEPDELSRRPSICPSGLGIGHSEATSLAAVETLGKNPKLQVTALTCKANVLAMRGDLTAARTAALEAVEAAKSSKDAAAHVAALYTLAVIQASPELEQKAEGVQAADEALQVAKSIGKSAEISALCLQATVQGDGAPAQAAFNLAGGDDLLEVESLCSLAQAQLNYSHLPSEALATSQKVLKLFTARKDTVGQAAAGSMVATCSSMMGQASVASAAASDACNVAEDMGSEVGALQTSMLSALSSNRPSEALDAGRRLLKIARHFEDPVAEAWALLELSRLQLAEDPGQGVRSAEEALAVATKASSTSPILGRRALANATVVLARAHVLREKAVAARRVVEKLQELPGRGSDALCHGRRGEALAQLLAAKVLQGSGPAVAAARNAQVLMKGVRDQAGEAAATLAVAEALSAQQNLDQAMEAASTAAMGFKAAKCGLGEGVALCTLATIQLRREDALEAEKTSKEALRIFQQVRSFSGLKRCLAVCGEARARQLLAHTQLTSLQPSSARVFFDEFNCAHLELTEMASQESLEAVVATLHGMQRQRNKVKAVVMHLDGVVGPANMHSYALSSGNFLVGLRSISVPVVLAASGKISGPSWQLVLGCDYRICSMDTDFLLPILSPPECLGELVGPAIASQLCISSGILDAQALQELGILNQVRPSKDETGRAASEMAKRIAAFPGIACRQTMSLLTVPPVRYTTVGSYKLPDPDLIA